MTVVTYKKGDLVKVLQDYNTNSRIEGTCTSKCDPHGDGTPRHSSAVLQGKTMQVVSTNTFLNDGVEVEYPKSDYFHKKFCLPLDHVEPVSP